MKNILFKYRYELSLALLTLIMLAAMEACHPYFFLQDDNRTYHLPYYVHNLKALLGGELPLFNFNQYLGTPVSFLSAPYYPINYLALLLSRLFLGHYFGAMEFVAAIHLVVAAVGFYRFCKGFGLEELSCCFGAVAWAFSPFVITLGDSWIHVLGFAAWLPWILLLSLRQVHAFSIRDFLLLLLCRLFLLLLGYPQWFLYAAFFEAVLVAGIYILSRRAAREGFAPVAFRTAANYLALFLISCPLLLQLFRESSLSFARGKVLSWGEYTLYSYRLKEWLNGLLVPFHDAGSHLFGELDFVSHVGYLTLFFALFAIFRVGKEKSRQEILLFASLALFALLWSANILITNIFYLLPFFNKLRYPFKLQFFTSFFLVTLATFGFNSFSAWVRDKFKGGGVTLVFILFVLHTINFLVLHTLLPQRMLSRHLDVPPFTEPLTDRLSEGRIVSAGPDVIWDGERVVPGNSVPTLGYNFAMLWGLNHFGGYEALLSQKNFTTSMELVNNSIFNVESGKPLDFSSDVPLNYLRTWGVRWYVVNRAIPLKGTDGLELVQSDPYRNVLHDPLGRPLVYWSDDVRSALPEVRFRANSVEISTRRSSEALLTVNVLFNPLFRGYLDGNEVPVAETQDGQMSVAVPPGEHNIRIEYVDTGFRNGLLVSLLFLCATVVWGVARFRNRQ